MQASASGERIWTSVDEIVAEVGRYAAEHPDDEWIIGASYNGSLAPDGLFDARWLAESAVDLYPGFSPLKWQRHPDEA